jgi:ABC-type lipoprotein release transport system permease subunit
MSSVTPSPTTPAAVQRQIILPLSKAIEIAYKSIRLRLSRSLLVTSGIVLALAFLISIQTSDAIINGMRRWIASAQVSPQFEQLRQRRDALTEQIRPMETKLHDQIAKAPKPGKDQPPFDPAKRFGQDFEEMKKHLGELPFSPAELISAFTARPELADQFAKWLDAARQRHAVKEELTAPQQLEAQMKANGVPTTEAEIASAKLQTRWLLGLALLVAFVGILNAMLMSVTERFREIGTMKCLGALDSFIIKLFLIESLFQGGVGTVIGILVGLLLSLAAATASYGAAAWNNLPWADLGLGVLISLAIGVGLTVAGAVYPAWQAARMQPIEAMRVET